MLYAPEVDDKFLLRFYRLKKYKKKTAQEKIGWALHKFYVAENMKNRMRNNCSAGQAIGMKGFASNCEQKSIKVIRQNWWHEVYEIGWELYAACNSIYVIYVLCLILSTRRLQLESPMLHCSTRWFKCRKDVIQLYCFGLTRSVGYLGYCVASVACGRRR